MKKKAKEYLDKVAVEIKETDWQGLKDKTKKTVSESWATTAVAVDAASSHIASTELFRSLNTYSSEISKAMDSRFLADGISKHMFPSNHRIMDGGHDFMSSIARASEVGEKNGWSGIETFHEWAASYFTDLSSPAGMPAFGKVSAPIYEFLKDAGLSEKNARDLVTVDGQEALAGLLGGTVAALGICFAWKSEDKDKFCYCVSSIVLGSAVSLNPVTFVIAIVALAIGYNRLVCKEALARGAMISGAGMIVGLVVPGPVIVGAIPAIVLSVYLSKKMGTDFKPIEKTSNFIAILANEEFRKGCIELFGSLQAKARPSQAAG